MPPVTFTIPGRIGGKQRAGRDFRHGQQHAFNPGKTASTERMIRSYAAEQMKGRELIKGAVRLCIVVHRTHPKSWPKKKIAATEFITGRPDCDNTIKLVADALNGIVWHDDAQVACISMVREYADHECISIAIEPLEDA
jgi:Holliday junction resolvase RusA-like endonuclease